MLTCTFAPSWSLRRRPRPHGAHTRLLRCPSGGVHPVGEPGQIVVEQAGVDVQRHRRRGTPEHALDALDVGPAGDREGGGGVPEVVRGDVAQAGGADRGVPDDAPPVAQP